MYFDCGIIFLKFVLNTQLLFTNFPVKNVVQLFIQKQSKTTLTFLLIKKFQTFKKFFLIIWFGRALCYFYLHHCRNDCSTHPSNYWSFLLLNFQCSFIYSLSNFTACFTPKRVKNRLEIFEYFWTQPAPSSRVASHQLLLCLQNIILHLLHYLQIFCQCFNLKWNHSQFFVNVMKLQNFFIFNFLKYNDAEVKKSKKK